MKKDLVIIFKNGHKEPVSQFVADTIRYHLIAGCPDYQCFSEEDDKNTFLIVNLKEVACITLR